MWSTEIASSADAEGLAVLITPLKNDADGLISGDGSSGVIHDGFFCYQFG
jgi:hypothetical protein